MGFSECFWKIDGVSTSECWANPLYAASQVVLVIQQFPEALKPLASSCLFATRYANLKPHPTRLSSFPIGGFYGHRGA